MAASSPKAWIAHSTNFAASVATAIPSCSNSKRTGIANLRVQFSPVRGFYIEVTAAGLAKVPADYPRPVFVAHPCIEIECGRHPLVEARLAEGANSGRGGAFIGSPLGSSWHG